MIKKILFFGIAIILGFLVLMVSYSGFQMSDVQGKITEYMATNDYTNLSRCFLPYFDANSIKTLSQEDSSTKVTVLESIHGVKTTITVNEQEQDASQYVASYTFYLQNFKDFDFNGVESNGTVTNYARVEFFNGDNSYVYYFNDPNTATSASGEGVNRYYTEFAQTLDFVEIDLPVSVIADELGGQITGLKIYDSKADTSSVSPKVDITFAPLTLDTPFLNLAGELVTAWNKYLEDLDADTFNNFFDPAEGEGWIDRFNATEGYTRGISGYDEIIGSSAIWKTVLVMVIYLVVCVALGFLFLRNRNKMPKPYLRDQYKKQMVSANSLKAEVKEVKESAEVNNNNVAPVVAETDNDVLDTTTKETSDSPLEQEDLKENATKEINDSSLEQEENNNITAIENIPEDVNKENQ